MTAQSSDAKNSILSQLSPDKQKIFQELTEGSKNLSSTDVLPFVLNMRQKLQNEKVQFSKDETSAIFDIISKQSLSPQEQFAFQTIKQLMNS